MKKTCLKNQNVLNFDESQCLKTRSNKNKFIEKLRLIAKKIDKKTQNFNAF